MFRRRTSVLLVATGVSTVALALVSVVASLPAVIGFLVLWSLAFAAATPVRQAYLNGLIPSQERATVLSFDSLLASAGGVVVQPALGRVADVWSYQVTFALGAAVQACAVPLIRLAQSENVDADFASTGPAEPEGPVEAAPPSQ